MRLRVLLLFTRRSIEMQGDIHKENPKQGKQCTNAGKNLAKSYISTILIVVVDR